MMAYRAITVEGRRRWRLPPRALVVPCHRPRRRRARQRPPAVSVSFDPISHLHPGLGRSATRRRRSPAAARSIADFKFTPAAAKGRPSQVRVAIRARGASGAGAPGRDRGGLRRSTALTPASYNLGVAVGWKRFAVAGDVAKVEQPRSGDRRPRERGGRRQLHAQQVHRPSRGRRRTQRRPHRRACASPTHIRSMSAAPIASAATSRSPAASATRSSGPRRRARRRAPRQPGGLRRHRLQVLSQPRWSLGLD